MYKKLIKRDKTVALVVFANAVFFVACFFLLMACNNNPPSEQPSLTVLKDTLKKQEVNYLTNCRNLFTQAKQSDSLLLIQNEIDLPSANKAIKVFTDFAYHCQSDTMSPVYLIKAAQVARAIDNIPQAKSALDFCIDNYPNFKDRPAALFLLAQLYDEVNYLNDETEAKRLYQKIIDEHPKSVWVASAKGAIDFIGKSDAEIIQQISKKKTKK